MALFNVKKKKYVYLDMSDINVTKTVKFMITTAVNYGYLKEMFLY